MCSRPRLDRQATYTECCCLYGEAWGMDCALCPAQDSGTTTCLGHTQGPRQPMRPFLSNPLPLGPTPSSWPTDHSVLDTHFHVPKTPAHNPRDPQSLALKTPESPNPALGNTTPGPKPWSLVLRPPAPLAQIPSYSSWPLRPPVPVTPQLWSLKHLPSYFSRPLVQAPRGPPKFQHLDPDSYQLSLVLLIPATWNPSLSPQLPNPSSRTPDPDREIPAPSFEAPPMPQPQALLTPLGSSFHTRT